MTFILFLSSAVVGLWVLLNFIPCNTAKNSFFDCSIFELLQNIVKVCTHWKNLSSVLIYLYRSWCSICKQLHRGLSLKKTPFKHSFMLCRIILHHLRSTICHTYTYQKCCSAPTHLFVNTGFTASLYNTIFFDHTIKAFIPTPRGLH